MRIGVLTFLHNGNYGSSLQAYSLQRVIREMGHVCEHIDYQPDLTEKAMNMLSCGNNPRLLIDGIRKRKVQSDQQGAREKKDQILDFYARRMQLSIPCHNRKELADISHHYDALVCGSDQIWNPVWMNPAYFLDFAEPEKTRIAYAPSLGISTEPGRLKRKKIRQLTALFDAISVREEEGARLMVTISGKRPPVMPDPVCLLTKAEWEEILPPVRERPPYLLCYFIGENPDYWRQAEDLAKKMNLEPLVIPVTAESYRQKMNLEDGAGPEKFLAAIAGADAVITDSFHGLAFSTIFEKPVEVIRRYREDDRESKNSRIDHFLREIKGKGLNQMRQEGLKWLEENLSITK